MLQPNHTPREIVPASAVSVTSPEDKMWLALGEDLTKGSIDAIEETGKNLLTSLGALSGLYFAAVSFEKVHDQISALIKSNAPLGYLVVLMFGLPVVFWLISMWYATLALTVSRHEIKHLDDPDEIRKQAFAIAADKYRYVRRSVRFLLAGLALLCVNLFLYLVM